MRSILYGVVGIQYTVFEIQLVTFIKYYNPIDRVKQTNKQAAATATAIIIIIIIN